MEPYSMLCDNLDGKEIQKSAVIWIHLVDSSCCIAVANTAL